MKILKNGLFLIALMMPAFFLQAVHFWSSAVPETVNLYPHGMVVQGNFNAGSVTCATVASAIYVPNTDPNFEHKLSMAIAAKMAGKRIEVLIQNGENSRCFQVSALGYVSYAFDHYWLLKD